MSLPKGKYFRLNWRLPMSKKTEKMMTPKGKLNTTSAPSTVGVLDIPPSGVEAKEVVKKERKPKTSAPSYQIYLNWDNPGSGFSVRDMTNGSPTEGKVLPGKSANGVIIEGLLKRVPAKEQGAGERRSKGQKPNHNWISSSTCNFEKPAEGVVYDDSNSRLIDLYQTRGDVIEAEHNEPGRFFIRVDAARNVEVRKLL